MLQNRLFVGLALGSGFGAAISVVSRCGFGGIELFFSANKEFVNVLVVIRNGGAVVMHILL